MISAYRQQEGQRMAAQVFAAIDVGAFVLEMGIYELSG